MLSCASLTRKLKPFVHQPKVNNRPPARVNCRYYHHVTKKSFVTLLLKKAGLNAEELKNYRPVSNLTSMSKLEERVVSSRLVTYLNAHGPMPQLQSAYRRHPSTETALLKVLSDVYAAIDRQQVTHC